MQIISILKHAVMISFFVFVMMLLVDFIEIASRGRMSDIIKGGRWRQYTLTSLLGSTPGCLGAFMNVSLYVHGLISFGAIVGGMIATSGDEAFVMLAQFPGTALALFGLLFGCGIVFAWLSDSIIPYLGITPCESCINARCEDCGPEMKHQKNISANFRRVNLIENFQPLSFTRFLLLMFIVSFLILITTGMLPLLSYSFKDSVLIKAFNLAFGLTVGGALFVLGL